MTLKPYNPEGKCPKCGYDGIRTRYFQYRSGAERLGEHLLRSCERCLYSWEEMPQDKQPPQVAEDKPSNTAPR